MSAGRTLIDAHVHVAVLGQAPHQGYASPAMHRSVLGRLVKRWLGHGLDEPEALSRAYRDKLSAALAASRHVRAAVVLALDGVCDARGEIDFARPLTAEAHR